MLYYLKAVINYVEEEMNKIQFLVRSLRPRYKNTKNVIK